MKLLDHQATIYRLLIFSALLFSSCSGTRHVLAIDQLKPCGAGGPGDGYCGTFQVWEDRQARSGRKIALNILLLPALKQESFSDPVFILADGPGRGATELFSQLEEPFQKIEAGRDIVFVDQRGTGASNPIECKGAGDENNSTASEKILQACLDVYKTKADLAQYTTEIAMDDLDDVRQFLGYSKINLYGVGYGSRAAMVYARRHQDHTRSVVLDGAMPTDMQWPLHTARDSQRALDLLVRDCGKDAGCSERFPNLRRNLEEIIARLDAHPEHIRYTHPRTGLQTDIEVTRGMITSALLAALYSPEESAMVPLLLEQGRNGNFSGFFALTIANPILDNAARGAYFSVVCSEDAPRIEPGSVAKETANTFLGQEAVETGLQPCKFWPHESITAAYFANSPSAVPGLILSGDLDPVTPPSWGAQVASQWKNSRHIIVPAAGHGTWSSGCVMKLVAQFLNEGDASKLDASCLESLQRPAFFLTPSSPNLVGSLKK